MIRVARNLLQLAERPLPKARQLNWKFGLTVFAGKLLGMALVIGLIAFCKGLFTPAHAAETYTPHETAIMNSLNTAWTLIAAFLVFGMQAGFVMLEAGFARTKETVNVLMECILDTAICGVLFWAIGYAFMFSHGNGFIGYHWFFLQGAPDTYESTGVAVIAHWIFQYAFADTCSTVTSGAMIGRTGFKGDILYSIGVTGFIYPIIGHWAWGPDGFLATMGTPDHLFASLGQGFRDFAGSTVVHTIGGFVSLAGAMVLGPRLGRIFARDDKERGGMFPPHNLPLATVGGFILWFGWYGFNPGSSLSAMDMQGIGRIATNTTLAACTGSLGAMIAAYFLGNTKGKFDLGFSVNGFLAGLVAITCPCYWVDPLGAVILGFVAGIIVYFGVNLLEWFRIDDPVGAVSVHGFCGIWGTWSLGLFASGKFGVTGPTGADNSAANLVKGLFYGGGTSVLEAQIIGNVTITVATFVVAYAMMFVIRKLPHPWNLRIEEKGEQIGIDIFEHGIDAYPQQA